MKYVTRYFKYFSVIIFIFSVLGVVNSSTAYAADMSQFNAGNIMSDYTMTNKNSMSVAQIQNFLSSKNSCNDTNTVKASWYPQYTYNIKNGKFVCLAEESFNGESAAQIIWQAAQDYTINPQVLIVLLEKEQGLITDTWPNSNVQYRSATGYGCPDTAACNTQYYGMRNQIRNAANFFRAHIDNNPCWSKPHIPGVQRAYWRPQNSCNGSDASNAGVRFHPNESCGATAVNIQNRATSGLYSYTPYQPNAAALNAGYGSGDGCSSYGNRNFWGLFTDWFGSTQGNSFTMLDTPRWMQVKNNNTYKTSIITRNNAGGALNAGQQIRFIDKIFLNGKWYLRTEYNYNDRGLYGIAQDQVREIDYRAISPRWMTFNQDGNRSHPASRTSAGDKLSKGTLVRVVDDISIDGNTYYRTAYNHDQNQNYGIHSRFLANGIVPTNLEGARYFCPIKKAITKFNPTTNGQSSNISGSVYINKKILLDGRWYFQAQEDNGTDIYIKASDLASGSCPEYVAFDNPRDMLLNQSVGRFNPITNEKYDNLQQGRVVHFSSKVSLEGKWYYRTTQNTQDSIDAVIPASAVSDLE